MSINRKLDLGLKKSPIGDGSMQIQRTQTEIITNFATMFNYPYDKSLIVSSSQIVLNSLKKIDSEAVEDIKNFLNYVENHDVSYLESSYTGIFELNPTIAPYVGFHLFGESYMRSVFLSQLKEKFDQHNFEYGKELPDHLCVILKFLSEQLETQLAKELVNDALRPMLNIIIWTGTDPEDQPEIPSSSNAYYFLFNGLRKFLDKLEGVAEIYPNNDSYNTVKLDVVGSMTRQSDKPTFIDQWISKGGKKNA